jgi:hypothetical protein
MVAAPMRVRKAPSRTMSGRALKKAVNYADGEDED